MPRRAGTLIRGYANYVLNRATGGLRLFRKEADFAAFEGSTATPGRRRSRANRDWKSPSVSAADRGKSETRTRPRVPGNDSRLLDCVF